MTMLFDIEQYRVSDSQQYKGDWEGVKHDSAWEDGSAFPNTTSKASLKETERSNKTDCWYSPPHIVELVIQVLGKINLDPCADDGRHIEPIWYLYTRRYNNSRCWLSNKDLLQSCDRSTRSLWKVLRTFHNEK